MIACRYNLLRKLVLLKETMKLKLKMQDLARSKCMRFHFSCMMLSTSWTNLFPVQNVKGVFVHGHLAYSPISIQPTFSVGVYFLLILFFWIYKTRLYCKNKLIPPFFDAITAFLFIYEPGSGSLSLVSYTLGCFHTTNFIYLETAVNLGN